MAKCVMAKKKGGSSWLTKVKSAFRSSNKESPEKKKNSKKCVEHDHDQDEEDKKRERRRWIFRKSVNKDQRAGASTGGCDALEPDQKHAIAIATASAPMAEAAIVTVDAAMEAACPPTCNAREDGAATLIQTAFRGYLARRALRALKGLVKLQALVRGHNVRKQAKLTLRCMQALVRVQTELLDQRIRLSHEDIKTKSAFRDTASLLESRSLTDTADRISMPKEGSGIVDDWDERPHTIEEIKAMLQKRKEASALRHEKKLSQVFSQQQITKSGRRPLIGNEKELLICPQRLDQWRAAAKTPFDSRRSGSFKARTSTDNRESIKTIEINTITPPQTRSYVAPNSSRKLNNQIQRPSSLLHRPNSPLHRSHQNGPIHHNPTTPSPAKAWSIQLQATAISHTSSQTPSLRSNYQYTGYLRNQQVRFNRLNAATTLPNYMAATESAKARLRSQSAPRPRSLTPESDRFGSAKKRLSFPVRESCSSYGPGSLRSPSFKSVSCSHYGGLEQQSNSSCCTESLGGEISPSSTSDLRRCLR